MSRIGKKLIKVPQGVTVKIEGSQVSVKGTKGELHRVFPGALVIKMEGDLITISLKSEKTPEKSVLALWGLSRALLSNMIIGVSEGFEKVLEFSGVGFKAQPKGNGLELSLGFSHPVIVDPTEGITFKVEKNSITVIGIDKEKIGHVAAGIRSLRPPEPYKGSGIKYKGEVILRKAGKKAATAGA